MSVFFNEYSTRDGAARSLNVVGYAAVFAAPILLLLIFMLWAWPQYKVWQQGLTGEAALKRAQQTKQIMIETARAEKDAAVLRAEAIGIIGQAAKDFPEYRAQEFMGAFGEALREGNINQVIYVPTEANVPILEAGKR